ncbi:MAG: hypothetical protein QM809_05270 [Gordonia sp. (in: high G+C Gram-positive bacteria)]|uniref:hypothetical protein n=1 Tax=Gordonia sp. (in: high G+C Gram-positive bacteria) TaxID=84139 RepID=UPI0039E284A9
MVDGFARIALPLWQIAHALTAVFSPWLLYVGYFLTSPSSGRIDDDARHAALTASVGAVVCVVLLLSTTVLRTLGPSAAATLPFGVAWAVGALTWTLIALDAARGCSGRADLCMPDIGVFLFGFLAAVTISISAVAAVLITGFPEFSADDAEASDI